jgi:YD repeat-containing protein
MSSKLNYHVVLVALILVGYSTSICGQEFPSDKDFIYENFADKKVKKWFANGEETDHFDKEGKLVLTTYETTDEFSDSIWYDTLVYKYNRIGKIAQLYFKNDDLTGDSRSRNEKYDYDSLGRLVSATFNEGHSNHQHRYYYNSENQIDTVKYYDDFIFISGGSGHSDTMYLQNGYVFDYNDSLNTKTQKRYYAGGSSWRTEDVVIYKYDSLNRLILTERNHSKYLKVFSCKINDINEEVLYTYENGLLKKQVEQAKCNGQVIDKIEYLHSYNDKGLKQKQIVTRTSLKDGKMVQDYQFVHLCSYEYYDK